MKTMMKTLTLVLALVIVVCCFAACGNDAKPADKDDNNDATTVPNANDSTVTDPTVTDPTVPDTTEPVDDGKKEYKIYVVDVNNNPVADVMVQICIDNLCNPKKTDENGVAIYRLPEGTNYTAGFTKYYEESKVYLEDKFEVTLVYNPPVAE